MDRLEALGQQLSQITMYDIKQAYNQAKNVVLNVSEMEAKVREATNEDPWGASSTLMQEIAQGTFNFQQFNEIMPCIYSRFMEKEARQWRQIYKGLTLLEYLIKHGSERVVDDARAHLSMLKMLRSFHYIDDKGKDEGINVRNRSKELVELLSDVEKIRAERRKAKANKGKYTGTGNDGLSFSSGGGRYGGFGNDSYSGGGGGSYSGGGGYVNDHYSSYAGGSSHASSGGFRDESRRGGGFEEYDAGDDEDRSTPTSPSRSQPSRTTPARKASAPAPAPAPAPVEDLLGGFDDDAFGSAPAPPPAAANNVNKALPTVTAAPSVGIDDDDFADFQAAPVQTTGTASPPPAAAPPAAPAKPNIMDLFGSTSTTASPTAGRPQAQGGFGAFQQQPMGVMNTGGSMGMGMGGMHRSTPSSTAQTPIYSSPPMQAKPLQPNFAQGMGTVRPASTPMQNTQTQPKPASSSNFNDLWSMSLGSSAKPAAATTGKSIKDLEKEKSMASLWGNSKPAGQGQSRPMGAGSNAFGSFGNAAPPSSSGGGDDLLL